jgi:hypothetical protein
MGRRRSNQTRQEETGSKRSFLHFGKVVSKDIPKETMKKLRSRAQRSQHNSSIVLSHVHVCTPFMTVLYEYEKNSRLQEVQPPLSLQPIPQGVHVTGFATQSALPAALKVPNFG